MIDRWLQLLGVFLRDGVGAARELVEEIPPELEALLGAQPDERAMQHEVMTRDVAAYASVYTSADGLARGDADHVGERLMAVGSSLEWAFPFLVALSHSGSTQHQSAAEILTLVLAEHSFAAVPMRQQAFDDSSLSSITTHLCMPVRCGAYLSTRVVELIARRVSVPRGFGARRQQLEAAFRHAGRFGVVEQLIAELQRELARWDRSYGRLSAIESLEPHVHPWQERVADTARALDGMQRQLRRRA